jgi:PleD family two-component response regulator
VSAGLFSCQPRAEMMTDEIMGRADALLYQAKNEGRDRLIAVDLGRDPRTV